MCRKWVPPASDPFLPYLLEDGNELVLEAVPGDLAAEYLAALAGRRAAPVRRRPAVDALPVPLHDRGAGVVGQGEQALGGRLLAEDAVCGGGGGEGVGMLVVTVCQVPGNGTFQGKHKVKGKRLN